MNVKNKNIRNVTRCLNTLLFSFILIFLSSCGTRKSIQDYFNVPKVKPFNVSKVTAASSVCSGIHETVSVTDSDSFRKHVVPSFTTLLFEIVLEKPENFSAITYPISELRVSDKVPLFIVYRKIKLLA